MKIWLSKKSERTGKRHVVLDMNPQEERDAFQVLRSTVLGARSRAPRRQLMRSGAIRYRFGRAHLDRLMSTFPFAELSSGLERRQHRGVTDAEPEEVPELDLSDLRVELYDYQKIAVGRAITRLDEQGWFFINDDLGLGKTVEALATLVIRQSIPSLVVCPNNAKWVWERMIHNFTSLEVGVLDATTQTRAQRTALIEEVREVTVANIEALRLHPELGEIPYQLIISDEYHRFKNPTAKQTVAWHALSSEDDLLLSGTPMLNRVEEIWSALHRVMPQRYTSYWAFERNYCIKTPPQVINEVQRDASGRILRNSRGRPIVKPKRVGGGRVVGYRPERFQELRDFIQNPDHSIRRRKEQVLDQLPEVVLNQLLIELTTEQRRLYNQIKNEMKYTLANGEIRSLKGILPFIMRAKQACFSPELYDGSQHSAKLDELKLVVQELVDGGHKALIGSQWSKATRIIRRELVEYNPAYVDGSVTGRKRQAEQDRFNEDETCWLYIGTIQANQEAITLSAADYVILTDKLWSPKANDQFIGRSAAGGLRGIGHDQVTVVELFAYNTIEERIETLLAEKRQMFNALIESDGGTPLQRTTVREIADLF